MKITITMKPGEEFSIPLSYHYQVQSMLYNLLKGEPKYADFLHESGFGTGFRLFTFGEFGGEYHIGGNQMIISGKISLEVRSPLTEFCQILKKTLLDNEEVRLFDRTLEVKMIETDNKMISEDFVKIKTLSPIVARFNQKDAPTVYYSPEQAEFADLIRRNLIVKYKTFSGIENDNFSFHYTGGAKRVVTQYKGTWVNAYHLNAELSGDPELIDFAYQTGLGSRSAQGFGMVEVVKGT